MEVEGAGAGRRKRWAVVPLCLLAAIPLCLPHICSVWPTSILLCSYVYAQLAFCPFPTPCLCLLLLPHTTTCLPCLLPACPLLPTPFPLHALPPPSYFPHTPLPCPSSLPMPTTAPLLPFSHFVSPCLHYLCCLTKHFPHLLACTLWPHILPASVWFGQGQFTPSTYLASHLYLLLLPPSSRLSSPMPRLPSFCL